MVVLALMATAAMSPGDGKTAALDDWHKMTILEVGGESGPYYLHVKAGDLDGDGKADDAIVKLLCADGKVQQALLRSRESGIGSPTERRQHAPVKIVKEWGPASPQLMAMKPTYDVKKMKGNERLASDGWSPVSLNNADGLCGATAAAAAAIVIAPNPNENLYTFVSNGDFNADAWASYVSVNANWTQSNWVSSNWVSSNWVSSNWVASNWVASNWVSSNWVSSNWVASNWVASNWAE